MAIYGGSGVSGNRVEVQQVKLIKVIVKLLIGWGCILQANLKKEGKRAQIEVEKD